MAPPHSMNAWRLDSMPIRTRKALEWLSGQAWVSEDQWYLAGGTALALHAGHRTSQYLDFFTPRDDFSLSAWEERFSRTEWKATVLKEGTVYGELMGAKVRFIAYPFFLHDLPYLSFGHVPVLQMPDIAVMKIIAISQRGKKRDFIDLYWYATRVEPLLPVLRRVSRQYPNIAHDFHHIIKSLAYFADAEEDPMPRLRFKVTWPQVRTFFQDQAKRMMKELVGIE